MSRRPVAASWSVMLIGAISSRVGTVGVPAAAVVRSLMPPLRYRCGTGCGSVELSAGCLDDELLAGAQQSWWRLLVFELVPPHRPSFEHPGQAAYGTAGNRRQRVHDGSFEPQSTPPSERLGDASPTITVHQRVTAARTGSLRCSTADDRARAAEHHTGVT